ncbi:MAG: MBL fold metallo-hydrolase [Deltaproteobacteria bacterium]|nr:MAG: MBL fold metallo-hydrolase [Deltaproteobacteria bacterium]
MEVYVTFWGTRGSIPTPGYRTARYGGNTACVEISTDRTLIICDAGTGIRELGLDMLNRRARHEVGHMFFSHAHWDHIQGFPFFPPVYMESMSFYVYSADSNKEIFNLLSGQMKSQYFPVRFSDLRARIEPRNIGDCGNRVDDFEVRCIELNHPGGATGYSFSTGNLKIAYLSDNELDQVLEEPESALKDPSAPRKVPDRFFHFVNGARLLIADGQYTDQEYPQKVGWGHSRATTLVDLAVAAGVEQLAITHHDPLQSDEMVDEKIDACRRRAKMLGRDDLVVFGAREGIQLLLEA